MPFPRPSLQELIDRTDAEISSRLGIGPLLRRSVLGVLSRVLAGASHLELGYQEWIARQILPQTAETSGLEGWCSLFGLTRKSATAAQGPILVSGSDGSVLPDGAQLLRSDGALFVVVGEAVIVDGAGATSARAVALGLGGNTPQASTLSLVSTVAGIVSPVIVGAGGLVGGLDQENDADLLTRLLQRTRNAPGAGTVADYQRWALEVPGVTRAFVYPLRNGPGSVGLSFAVDDDPAGPIPTADQVDLVQTHIGVFGTDGGPRPVTVNLVVFAPTPAALDPTIHLAPDTAAIRADVGASLADILRREGAPGGTILLSHLRQAISTAQGVVDYELVDPVADFEAPAGGLPVLGTITWV